MHIYKLGRNLVEITEEEFKEPYVMKKVKVTPEKMAVLDDIVRISAEEMMDSTEREDYSFSTEYDTQDSQTSQKPSKMSVTKSEKTPKMPSTNSEKTQKMPATNSEKTQKMPATNSEKTQKMPVTKSGMDSAKAQEETIMMVKKKTSRPAVVITTNLKEAPHALHLAGIVYDGEIDLANIEVCKVEALQECVVGTLNIPRLSDVRGLHFKIQFFSNKKNIVIVDNSNMTEKLIRKICQNRTKAGNTRERFLYNYISQFISRDLEYLGGYEKRIVNLEDRVLEDDVEEFQDIMIPIRRELLILHSYYMELRDLGKELEENENNFFSKRNLSYFGIITDRAERLLNKSNYLLEYVEQVKDAYQTEVAKEQNKNMEFLTVMSTIFYPLTLITGWYGMNFKNMPELVNGYPFVIGLSIVVIVIIIIIFKKRKIM